MSLALAKMVGGGISVASVTFNYRKSTGKAYGQGSHTTAWTSFEDMVQLRVEKQTLPSAAQRLQDCFNELQDFPGADTKSPKYIFARDQAGLAIVDALATPDEEHLEIAMESPLDMPENALNQQRQWEHEVG